MKSFDGARMSFALLQHRSGIKDPEVARVSPVRVYFYVFDMTYAQGRDTTRLALLDRKRVLRRALDCRDPVRYSAHRHCEGERYFAQACTRGWERLIAKETTSAYVPRRLSDWLKLKCSAGQEFVVGGFTEPAGSRMGLGAVLVGYYDDKGDLIYAGKVGTGFDRATLVELRRRLGRLGSDRPAFTPAPKVGRGGHWTRPELLVQLSFTEWTFDNKLRHPRFEGLREDKQQTKSTGKLRREGHPMAGSDLTVGKHSFALSHPDKLLFSNDALTKQDLVGYYRTVAHVMVPHLQDRPLMLARFPDGIQADGFYQKEVPGYFPDWVHRATVGKKGGELTQVVCDDEATLAYLAAQACITFHSWLSRSDKPDMPDRLVFDLDPSRDDDFPAVRSTAADLRQRLEDLGLVPFVQTTGSRGLHVVFPIERRQGFDEVRFFAHDLAAQVVSMMPDERTTEARKDKRRGRVFVDIQCNAYAQTSVAPYSVRPLPGAPVAAPLEWRELEEAAPASFKVAGMPARLGNRHDPWEGIGHYARPLGKAVQKFVKRSRAGWAPC